MRSDGDELELRAAPRRVAHELPRTPLQARLHVRWGGQTMDEQDGGREAFPRCRRCGEGDLVPLSDYGGQGAEVRYKAWVCSNHGCRFNLKIRNGEIVRGEPVTDASGGDRGRPSGGPLPVLGGGWRGGSGPWNGP